VRGGSWGFVGGEGVQSLFKPAKHEVACAACGREGSVLCAGGVGPASKSTDGFGVAGLYWFTCVL